LPDLRNPMHPVLNKTIVMQEIDAFFVGGQMAP
jgi:hypothetical protein